MRIRRRLRVMLAAVAATAGLGLAVTDASANRLQSNGNRFYASIPNWTFDFGGLSVVCAIEILASFHFVSFTKTRGALVGHYTHFSVQDERCTGGGMTVLDETLPWHITFEAYSGTLPNLSGIELLLEGIGLLIEGRSIGTTCRLSPGQNSTMLLALDAEGDVTSVILDESVVLSIDDTTGILCDFAGTSTISGIGTAEEGEGGPSRFTLI